MNLDAYPTHWTYVGEYNTDRDKPARLVALFRTGPHPRYEHDDQILTPFGWWVTDRLSHGRRGRSYNDFIDLDPGEARRIIDSKRSEWEQNLARSVHIVVQAFVRSGFPDAAECVRSAYSDLRLGVKPASSLHELLGTDALPKTSVHPEDIDAYADFEEAWDLVEQMTQPRPGMPVAESSTPGER